MHFKVVPFFLPVWCVAVADKKKMNKKKSLGVQRETLTLQHCYAR